MKPLRQRWHDWEALPYPSGELPPGSFQSEVQGVDLALADGDAAAVFHQYFTQGMLGGTDDALLAALLEGLPKAIPHLQGRARDYFETALLLLRDVDGALRRNG